MVDVGESVNDLSSPTGGAAQEDHGLEEHHLWKLENHQGVKI